jgi:Tol biopolymer transport system component
MTAIDVIGRTIGSYRIVSKLGEGGMGEVYRATDAVLKRDVALKLLPAAWASNVDRLARLHREAELLASLNHPNIAAIYGIERADGVVALVMELVEGPTLADRVREGPLPLADALPIARQIADGLEAAHGRSIVHRDLKPANIKVRPDGTVKLLDFGLAKSIDGASGPAAPGTAETVTSPALLTEVGTILGTASYMAPEQAKGRPADTRSDVWAFGVITAEMTTGRRLFEAETVAETISAVLTRDPDLDDVPLEVRRMVRACLVRDPRGRLRHIGDAMTLVDTAPHAMAGRTTPRVRPGVLVAGGLLVAAIVVAAVGWGLARERPAGALVTRFYVDAPPGAAFNYTYTAAAISPDGRQIVFRVATATGAPALWLRPLDSFVGRRLVGTDGADFPFWSADGRSIGFFSAGKLERVDTSGGAPIVLCEAPDADSTMTGGAWNQNGILLFGAPEGIYRVSASGGTPALIAPISAAAGETGYGSPQFLPDGDRFLMFVRSEDPARAGYYVTSLSHPDRKTRVLDTQRKALFVSNAGGESSYLLYLQNGNVLARPIDRRTLALTREPVVLASNVALFPPGFQASFWSSASGNLLAYRTDASDRPRFTWIDPGGNRRVVSGTSDFYTHLRVSPDGSHAAMELADATGNMDVWTLDFARQTKTRQTFDPKPDRAPTWAPNGHEIAFSSARTGVWQIFRKDLDTGQPEEQLTTGPRDKIVPDWSGDGRYLVYIQLGTTTAEDIWALPMDGSRQPFPVLQTVAVESNPSLSPDGRWLAYESSQSGRPEIYVTRFPASHEPVPVSAPRWQVSVQGGSRPRWSGDGRGLLYVSLDERSLMRAAVRTRHPAASGPGSSAGAFESDTPEVFADIPVMSVSRSPFDVTADGRVILLERTVSQSVPLAIITDWRQLMAAK